MDTLFQLKVSEFAIRNSYTVTVTEYEEDSFLSLDEIPISSIEVKDNTLKILVAPDDIDLLYFIDKKTFRDWMKELNMEAKDIPVYLQQHFGADTQVYNIYDLVRCMKRFYVIPEEPYLEKYIPPNPVPDAPDAAQKKKLDDDIAAHKLVITETLAINPSTVDAQELAMKKEDVSNRTILLKAQKAEFNAMIARRDEVTKRNEEIKKQNAFIEKRNQDRINRYESVFDVFRSTERFVGLLMYRRAKSMRRHFFGDVRDKLPFFTKNPKKRVIEEPVTRVNNSPPNKYIKLDACGGSATHGHHHVMPVVPPSPPTPPPPPPAVIPSVIPDPEPEKITKLPPPPRSPSPPPTKQDTPPPPPPPPVVVTKTPDPEPKATKLPPPTKPDTPPPKDPEPGDLPVVPKQPPVPPPPGKKKNPFLDELKEKLENPSTLRPTAAPDVIVGDKTPFFTDGKTDSGVLLNINYFKEVFDNITPKLREYFDLQTNDTTVVVWQCMCVLWFHTMMTKFRTIRDLSVAQEKWLSAQFALHAFRLVIDDATTTRNVGAKETAFYESLLSFNMDQIILQQIQGKRKGDVTKMEPAKLEALRVRKFNQYFPRILRLAFFPIDVSFFTQSQKSINEMISLTNAHNKKEVIAVFDSTYLNLKKHEDLLNVAVIGYNASETSDDLQIYKPGTDKTKKMGTNGVDEVTMDASI